MKRCDHLWFSRAILNIANGENRPTPSDDCGDCATVAKWHAWWSCHSIILQTESASSRGLDLRRPSRPDRWAVLSASCTFGPNTTASDQAGSIFVE